MKCPQELCQNWTGQGCACEVLDLEPGVVDRCACGTPWDEVPLGHVRSVSLTTGERACRDVPNLEISDRWYPR